MPPASAIPLDLAESQEAILAFLGAGSAFAGHGPPVRVDTHAASIFLSGTRAWKLKRAVRFDYLDFSTPERRHAALQTELRLERFPADVNRWGFPRVQFSDSGFMLMKEVGMDGSRAFTGSS